MTAEVAQTPEARQAAAKAAIKAREDGIRANAIKQGMEQERRAQQAKLAELQAAHAGEIAGIRQAHHDELERHDERWKREEAKHGSARFWAGASVGLFVAGAMVSVGLAIFVNTVLPTVYDSARQARVQDDVVRTLDRAVN